VNWVVVRSSLEVPVEVDLVPLGPMGRDSADVIPCNAAGYTHAEPFKPSDVMTAPAPESMPRLTVKPCEKTGGRNTTHFEYAPMHQQSRHYRGRCDMCG